MYESMAVISGIIPSRGRVKKFIPQFRNVILSARRRRLLLNIPGAPDTIAEIRSR